MTSSDGSEVNVWETGKVRHLNLALDPFIEGLEIRNILYVPERCGYGQMGDGYEQCVKETVKRFFYSIPVFIGWFAIIISFFLIRKIWKQTINRSVVRYFLKIGSIFMLIAVPLLLFDFYNQATIYKPYFHLGIAAYLIVFSYLFVGVSLIGLTLSKKELS